MSLLRLAHVPAPSIEPHITVARAVSEMARQHVGAVVVVEYGVLRGIFTERDLMLRVVNQGRDPVATMVRDVMTTDVQTITEASSAAEASDVMLEGHLRHLPVIDAHGQLLGLLSMRALLEERLDDLRQEVSSLEQYMANDGPGG
jgi:CBS domain-containing protein